MEKRPSTGQLLNSLESLQQQAPISSVALVISVNGKTELVFGDQGTAVARLSDINRAIAHGGKPVGYIAVSPEGKTRSWPMEQYQKDSRVLEYLQKIESAALRIVLAMPDQEFTVQ